MTNSLDPDQVRHFVGPDLGPKGLQKLSADKNVAPSRHSVKYKTTCRYYFLAKTLAKVNFIQLVPIFFHLAKVLATTNSEQG